MSPILQSLANGSARGYGAFFGAAAGPAFESIASATGTGSSNTITFSSIPSTYQHLQIRINALGDTGGSLYTMRFNGDSGSNYARHYIYGGQLSVSAAGGDSTNSLWVQAGGGSATYPTVAIIDIHDYANTSKYKTQRVISGFEANDNTSWIQLSGGLWMNTSAVTSISIIQSTYNFTTDSTFALYGIKGA